MRKEYKVIQYGIPFVIKYVKRFFRKNRFIPRPVPNLSIETTNICDSKCVFCPNKTMKRRRQHLEMPIFKKAVDEFASLGGNRINFNTIIGDPLLDPHLLERARYVKQFPQFKSLGFVTTLQWLHRFDMDKFFESGISWLGVSSLLSGRENYIDFFGVDKYDIFLKNLLTLIEQNNKRKNKIYIYIDIKPTDESFADIINHPHFKMINSLVTQDLVAAVKKQGLYVDDWLGMVHLPSYLKKRPLYPRMFRPCGLLYAALILFSNGKAGACSCRDYEADSELILGNLNDLTIEEMWNGRKLASIRSDWRRRNKIPDICKNCRHYLY